MDSNDRSLRCVCSNGHRIRASQKYAGQNISCPACGVTVRLPRPEKSSITDTGAVRILNDLESEFQDLKSQQPREASVRVEKTPQPERACPRCKCEISKQDQVCPECKLILASGSRVFQRIYKAALRSLN